MESVGFVAVKWLAFCVRKRRHVLGSGTHHLARTPRFIRSESPAGLRHLPRHIELATGRAVTAALPVGQGGPKPCESELLTRSGTFFQKIRHLVYYFVTLRLALME
jgi:hypothetical protein